MRDPFLWAFASAFFGSVFGRTKPLPQVAASAPSVDVGSELRVRRLTAALHAETVLPVAQWRHLRRALEACGLKDGFAAEAVALASARGWIVVQGQDACLTEAGRVLPRVELVTPVIPLPDLADTHPAAHPDAHAAAMAPADETCPAIS